MDSDKTCAEWVCVEDSAAEGDATILIQVVSALRYGTVAFWAVVSVILVISDGKPKLLACLMAP